MLIVDVLGNSYAYTAQVKCCLETALLMTAAKTSEREISPAGFLTNEKKNNEI